MPAARRPVDLDGGLGVATPDLGVEGVPAARVPGGPDRAAVVLDTAASALAAGERWMGDARHVDSFITLVVDVTVESAVVVRGRPLHGAQGNAGSLAHVIVEPGGPPCWCGALGCLSALVSATDLEREMNRPLRRATDTIIDRTGIMIGRARRVDDGDRRRVDRVHHGFGRRHLR